MSKRRKMPKHKLRSKERRLEHRRRDRQDKARAREKQRSDDDDDEPGRVVCDTCRLEQRHRTGVTWAPAPCEGALGLLCLGEIAITPEHHAELAK